MRSRWIAIGAGVVASLASIVLWSRLPADVAIHWTLRGDADGHTSRAVAAILGPAMVCALAVAFHVFPRIDPRRENYAKFADVYALLMNALIVFIAMLHVATLASAAGLPFDMARVLSGTLAAFMIVFGNSLGRLRQNWFLGIRTPWTLEHPMVWRKTHRFAGWLFVTAGVVTALATALPSLNPMTMAGVTTIAAAAGSVLASFVFWLRERRT
jgi:uncharacterized membrane protein